MGIPAGAPTTRITLYFPRLLADGSLGLSAAQREVPTNGLPRAAIEALVDGPDGDERAADYEYPLSPRTQVVSFEVRDRIATVEFGPELARVRGRPFSELAYWSIVYTLTGLDGVDGITLVKDGVSLEEFGYPPVRIPGVAGRAAAPGWIRPI